MSTTQFTVQRDAFYERLEQAKRKQECASAGKHALETARANIVRAIDFIDAGMTGSARAFTFLAVKDLKAAFDILDSSK